jgi:hypothetical protein
MSRYPLKHFALRDTTGKVAKGAKNKKRLFLLTFYWSLLKFAALQAWAES